jgi:hypothetical protein
VYLQLLRRSNSWEGKETLAGDPTVECLTSRRVSVALPNQSELLLPRIGRRSGCGRRDRPTFTMSRTMSWQSGARIIKQEIQLFMWMQLVGLMFWINGAALGQELFTRTGNFQ